MYGNSANTSKNRRVIKKQAVELFSQLGMDMSSAMNIFLRQCVMRGGLPFAVEVPQYKPEVIEAMEDESEIEKIIKAVKIFFEFLIALFCI